MPLHNKRSSSEKKREMTCDCECKDEKNAAPTEIGAALIIVLALGYTLKQFSILQMHSTVQGFIGLGTVFVVGLTAAVSTCLAVVGGLLLSVSATWNLSLQGKSPLERFEPLALFNIGRLAGYFLLGGLVGLIGTSLTLSSRTTGILTVMIALIMASLGLRILRIVPKKYCTIPLPQSWMKRLKDLSASRNPFAPFLLGALTFFLPCGFTQSMQLLALGSGSFLMGGLIMLTFALGTLPSLLGISLASAFATGRAARIFTLSSGCAVLLLGVLNLQSGFVLMGIDPGDLLARAFAVNRNVQLSPDVSINEKGQQIISLNVTDFGYTPNSVTIEPNHETWIYATAPNGLSGCATTMTAPAYGISTFIHQGTNWLGPIKNPTSDFLVTCSMGMMRTNIHVKRSS